MLAVWMDGWISDQYVTTISTEQPVARGRWLDARASLKLAWASVSLRIGRKCFREDLMSSFRDTPSPPHRASVMTPDKSLAARGASRPLQTSNDPWHSFYQSWPCKTSWGPQAIRSRSSTLLCFRSFQFLGQDKNTQAIYHSISQSIFEPVPKIVFPSRALHRFDSSITRRSPPCQPPALPAVAARAVLVRGRSVTSHSAFGSRL